MWERDKNPLPFPTSDVEFHFAVVGLAGNPFVAEERPNLSKVTCSLHSVLHGSIYLGKIYFTAKRRSRSVERALIGRNQETKNPMRRICQIVFAIAKLFNNCVKSFFSICMPLAQITFGTFSCARN